MINFIKNSAILLTFTLLLSVIANGQGLEIVKDNVVPTQKAFQRGCLLVSISEGTTTANYSTHKGGESACHSPAIHSSSLDGERDPLFVEFGVTNHWGIGLSSGNDIFNVNASNYYGLNTVGSNEITATTKEFTFDLNYHFYTSRKVDLSVYSSVGSFGVAFIGTAKEGDKNFGVEYNAKGSIVRVGTKARYYFRKRFGVLGMLSYYSGSASPDGVKGNTLSTNITTKITGYALEFGLCYRFF